MSGHSDNEFSIDYDPKSRLSTLSFNAKGIKRRFTGTEEECHEALEALQKGDVVAEQPSGGIKLDQGKPGMYLVPYTAVAEIAKVLDFGAKKYAPGNWAKGIAYSRLISAAERHLGAFKDGEDKDPESSLSHVAHLGCCVLFLMWMVLRRPDLDDRWSKEIECKK